MFAEEVADIIALALGVSACGTTNTSLLPGGDWRPTPSTRAAIAARFGISRHAAARLVCATGRAGSRCFHDGGPRATVTVCRSEPVPPAIRYAVKGSKARTLQDVARRTKPRARPLRRRRVRPSPRRPSPASCSAGALGSCARAADLIRARRSRLPAIGAAQARVEGIGRRRRPRAREGGVAVSDLDVDVPVVGSGAAGWLPPAPRVKAERAAVVSAGVAPRRLPGTLGSPGGPAFANRPAPSIRLGGRYATVSG